MFNISWKCYTYRKKPCAAADFAVCSTASTSPFNETDSYLLLFALPPVLLLFKSLPWILAYLVTLSGRGIETDDLPLECLLFITYLITYWSILWLWERIIRCSLSLFMHCFSSYVTYIITVFTRVHSIRIKPSRIIIVHIWIAGNFSWISINSSATLS